MSLFSEKLSLDQILHLDSILDGKGMDTDLLAIHNALNQKPWNPMEQIQTPIQQPSNPIQQPLQSEQQPPPPQTSQNGNTEENMEMSEKNTPRKYIELEDAEIRLHQHQYRERQIEKSDVQTRNSRTTTARSTRSTARN